MHGIDFERLQIRMAGIELTKYHDILGDSVDYVMWYCLISETI